MRRLVLITIIIFLSLVFLLIIAAFTPIKTPVERPSNCEGVKNKIDIEKAIDVKKRNGYLILIPSVVGHGVGTTRIDDTCYAAIKVYVKKMTLLIKLLLPNSLEGIPVEIVVTGEIRAL